MGNSDSPEYYSCRRGTGEPGGAGNETETIELPTDLPQIPAAVALTPIAAGPFRWIGEKLRTPRRGLSRRVYRGRRRRRRHQIYRAWPTDFPREGKCAPWKCAPSF